MVKVCFINDEKVAEAIRLVAGDIGITITAADECDVRVTVNEADAPTVQVDIDGRIASITYGDGLPRFLRGLAILAFWLK